MPVTVPCNCGRVSVCISLYGLTCTAQHLYCPQMYCRERPLKLVVTSATLDGEKFSQYFMSCPVFHVRWLDCLGTGPELDRAAPQRHRQPRFHPFPSICPC